MSEFVWWYGLLSLSATSAIGTLWLIDNSIEWFLEGFALRVAFLQWYAQRLREKRALSPTDGAEPTPSKVRTQE